MILETQRRPNDERGFIHKKLGAALRGGLRLVGASGVPGFSQVARIGSSLLRGGSRDPRFQRAVGAQLGRGALQSLMLQRQSVQGQFGQGQVVVQTQIGGGARGAGAIAPGSMGECPKGFRLNKSTYYIQSSGELVQPRTRCVKIRRRNPDNGRAARHAASRLLQRKTHQDRIDKALQSLVKGKVRRARPALPSGQGATRIINVGD